MVIVIILCCVVLLPILQIAASQKRKAVKNYFTEQKVEYILVCQSDEMKAELEQSIDRSVYQKVQVVSLDALTRSGNTAEILRNAVRIAGVQELPCMLRFDGYDITGRYYRAPIRNA